MVLAALDSDELRGQLSRPSEDQDAESLLQLEAELDRVADDYATGQIGRREWLRIRDGIVRRLQAAKEAQARTVRPFAIDGRTSRSIAAMPS